MKVRKSILMVKPVCVLQVAEYIYQHTKFELNRCSLSKVIERTPNFGRTDERTDERTHARTDGQG